MTVTVPPRLARRETAAPTDAFLLRDPARLPTALSALGPKQPAVFRVAGGFLLVPADAAPHRLPAAIPLRRLAGDLYVPADADLLPTLLPDELTALTRDRGMVVLPGQTLGFAADRPLAPAGWLHLPPLTRGAWEPLPDPEPLADRLTVIERPAGSVIVEQLLAEGGPADPDPLGDGAIPDDARPPAGGPVANLAAGAGMAAGKFLAALGNLLRSPGLAKLGAGLVARAVEQVPRLSEKVLGAQEAALRQLLKQLQSGDAEAALRRAPVAVGDPSAPARVETGSRLFSRDIGYSLRSLLGGGGVASAWLGGGDVWHQFAAEYRRQADAAAARGDHRRAAYIHGVLLRDLHAAAAALLKGGLYRDAAVLYRDRLNAPVQAARAFDQAGDFDEAVRLYVRAGHDEEAGDLLMQLGLADRAAERFVAVANRHVVAGRLLAAGDLLRAKLGDRAAGGYYLMGWGGNGPESVACGERLFDFLAKQTDWPGVRSLLADAGARLGPPRAADAGRFFNRARSADLPAELRDELDDRARLLFASHLRAAPTTARSLFTSWPGPVTRDALFAARGADRPEPGRPAAVPLADGTTLAVAVARGTGDLLVATDTAVVLWRPDAGRVLPVCRPGGRRVCGLAVDDTGDRVFVLKTDGKDLVLDSYAAAGERFEYRCQRRFPNATEAAGGWALHPCGPRPVLDVLAMRLHLDPTLMHDLATGPPGVGPAADLVVDAADGRRWEWRRVTLTARQGRQTAGVWNTYWTPAVPAGSPLAVPPVDWRTAGGLLEVVGLDADGVLHWGEWQASDPEQTPRQAQISLGGCRAAALLGPGRVASVTASNRLDWLRAAGNGLFAEAARPTQLAVPAPAVAIVARPHAGEVAVVFADGSAARVPVPS